MAELLQPAATVREITHEGGTRARRAMASETIQLESYLADCRELTLEQIRRCLPVDRRHAAGLYELMLDYPLRPAKALRPALCMASCLALGGHLDGVLPSACAFELFHNAFLVHDDVEDGSALRRHGPTLHLEHGVPIAVNVGDGLLALALDPLLDNVRALGLGPALKILSTFSRMARESVEGQMLELDWVRRRRWDLRDGEYLRMVHKKTGWYSFIAPLQVGAIAAGASGEMLQLLGRFGLCLGIAFQIQDDILSLEGDEAEVGKDGLGDLWEGKYTLPLLHAVRTLPPPEAAEAVAILRKPRPSAEARVRDRQGQLIFDKVLAASPDLNARELDQLRHALAPGDAETKDERSVRRLWELVTSNGGTSVRHARSVAERLAARAARLLEHRLAQVPESVHKQFLRSLVDFVTRRSR